MRRFYLHNERAGRKSRFVNPCRGHCTHDDHRIPPTVWTPVGPAVGKKRLWGRRRPEKGTGTPSGIRTRAAATGTVARHASLGRAVCHVRGLRCALPPSPREIAGSNGREHADFAAEEAGTPSGIRTRDLHLERPPRKSASVVDVSGSTASEGGTTVNKAEKASIPDETNSSANSEDEDDPEVSRGGFE